MVYNIVRKALLAGIGAQEKVKDLLDELVNKGELSDRDSAKLLKEWANKAKSGKEDLDRMVSDTMHMGFDKANIATKDELDTLKKKVQQLSVRLKKLENAAAPTEEQQ